MASKYLQKYPIPSKFQEILHDFTKEVLRAQDDDIILFAYKYFDAKAKGLEYKYESKFNVQKQGQSKQHSKVPHDQLTTKAQKVVQQSNQDERQASEKDASRQQRSVTGKSAASGKSGVVGSETSHVEEKQLTKELMVDIYSNALGEAVQGKNDNAGEENSQQFSEKSQNVTHFEEKQVAREFSSNIYDKALNQISPTQQRQNDEDGGDEQQLFGDEQQLGEDAQEDEQQLREDAQEDEKQLGEDAQEDEQQLGEDAKEKDGQIEETEEQREIRRQTEYTREQLGYGQEVQLDGKLEDYESAALKIQKNYRKKQVNK